MPDYSNGYIPENLLVIFARGANTVDGAWFHGLPAATYARHLRLVELARERTGKTLRISDGWGAYRPYAAQQIARAIYGNGAAWPGTSSHGGVWEGRQTAAMDYSNWGDVYGWDRAAFAADCYAAGLTPNMIVPARGYPDEPWHVIDLDPWGEVPAGFDSTAFPLEDDMPTMQEFLNTPAYDGGPTISAFFKAVDQGGVATQVWGRVVDRGLDGAGNPLLVSAIQELADAKTLAMQILGKPTGEVSVDVDEAALAASLAPLITANLSKVSDEDVKRLAVAAADEQDRRARERLGA